MDTPVISRAEEDIRRIIGYINEAWTEGRTEDLARFFHKDIVFVQPGFTQRLEGIEACIGSYREFLAVATVHNYRESGWDVDVWGDTAVAGYHFEISYDMDGRRHDESGHDVFVFSHKEGIWLAVWRTMIVPGAGE